MVPFNKLQHICAVVALFSRNVGIGVQCHPPCCSVVEVEDGCSAEKCEPIDAGQTFNVFTSGKEGRGIKLAQDASTS